MIDTQLGRRSEPRFPEWLPQRRFKLVIRQNKRGELKQLVSISLMQLWTS